MKYTVFINLKKIFADETREIKMRGCIHNIDGVEHDSGLIDVHWAREGLCTRRKNSIQKLINSGNYDIASVLGGIFDYEYIETWIAETGIDSITFRIQDSKLIDQINM